MDCAGEDARDAMEMAVGAATEAEISLGALDAMEMDQLIAGPNLIQHHLTSQ